MPALFIKRSSFTCQRELDIHSKGKKRRKNQCHRASEECRKKKSSDINTNILVRMVNRHFKLNIHRVKSFTYLHKSIIKQPVRRIRKNLLK